MKLETVCKFSSLTAACMNETTRGYRFSAFVILLLLLTSTYVRSEQNKAVERHDTPYGVGTWHPVSNDVLEALAKDGKKPGYPGGTAGVSVDRVTGEVRMIVPDQGIWNSSNRGVRFIRIDGGNIGGRCETGYALNADPAGKRLACFMLDGQSGMTLDNGKSWTAFLQHGRGWDFGAVDWSSDSPNTILGLHHESGGELRLSLDGGKSWKLLGKDYTAIGVFDAKTLLASKGDGILRSTDGGENWTKVSERTPTGRVLSVWKGVGYWATQDGLLVSKDGGLTWKQQGTPIETAWGPFFGNDEKQISVVGRIGGVAGIYRTDDGGETWKIVAPLPPFTGAPKPDWTPSKQWAAGWFINFGWDPKHNLYYASRMGSPTLAIKLN